MARFLAQCHELYIKKPLPSQLNTKDLDLIKFDIGIDISRFHFLRTALWDGVSTEVRFR